MSERTLLFLGPIGGWPGVILAQLTFRHKTQKQSFRGPFWATVFVNVLVVAGVVAVQLNPQLLQ